MDLNTFAFTETSRVASASLSQVRSVPDIQKQMVWSNFADASQNTCASLMNHLKASYLGSQHMASEPTAMHGIDQQAIRGSLVLPVAGSSHNCNSRIFHQQGGQLSSQQERLNATRYLLDSTTSGNIFDHPMLQSSSATQKKIGRAQRRASDVHAVLDESLDLLLRDDFLPLDGDESDAFLGNRLMGSGPNLFASSSVLKRKETQLQMAHNAKRRRTSQAPRFRGYQEKQWEEQFQELLQFKEKREDCLVPHNFPEKQTLSRWVKRQRYQYKLKQEGKISTMTDSRIKKLEDVGFVWDSHAAAWQERLGELKAYVKENGDCHVPSNYPKNPKLATWVKCQRRQGKLFWNGKASNMTLERVAALNDLGFAWGMRLMTM